MATINDMLREIADLKVRSENQDIEILMLHNAIVDHAIAIGEHKAEIEKLKIANGYLDESGVEFLNRQAD